MCLSKTRDPTRMLFFSTQIRTREKMFLKTTRKSAVFAVQDSAPDSVNNLPGFTLIRADQGSRAARREEEGLLSLLTLSYVTPDM